MRAIFTGQGNCGDLGGEGNDMAYPTDHIDEIARGIVTTAQAETGSCGTVGDRSALVVRSSDNRGGYP